MAKKKKREEKRSEKDLLSSGGLYQFKDMANNEILQETREGKETRMETQITWGE